MITIELLNVLLAWLVKEEVLAHINVDGMQAYTLCEHDRARTRIVTALQAIHKRGLAVDFTEKLACEGDTTLAPEQRKALGMVAREPIVYIPAPPGCGKTYLLEKLQQRLGADQLIVYTQNNCMVDALTVRGIKHAQTLQYPIYHMNHRNLTRQSARVAADLHFYPIVCIDEFSNVGLTMSADFYELLCSQAVRVVHLYDPNQIHPIKPGNPCVALPLALPQLVCPLTVNHRILAAASGDSAPVESLMLANDRALVKGQGWKMEFQHVKRGDVETAFPPGTDCLLLEPSALPQQDLRWALRTLVPNGALENVQVIALHNDTCKVVNRIITTIHAPEDDTTRIERRARLTPGVRFTVVGSSFPQTLIYPTRARTPPAHMCSAYNNIPAHTDTHIHTYIHTYTHTYIHTHTHRHTHTY